MSGVGLFIGSTPVTAVYVGSTPVPEVYVGSQKIWPTIREVVQITLGTGYEARDQFQAALLARGLSHTTVTEIPFEIELIGTGSTRNMFERCSALTEAPAMNTSGVTNMAFMFYSCRALTYVPDMDTAQVTDTRHMFYNCASLTDGNVRLIGRHPQADTTGMITGSGLTREPWDTATPPVARTVTINGSVLGWDQATATGDTGLIQEWIGGDRVRFHAPTSCDQDVYNATSGLVLVDAGSTIPAGAPIQSFMYDGPYIFTEVL